MNLTLLCVGRMKDGPERQLFERYYDRVGKLAPQTGFHKPRLIEIPESRLATVEQRKADEAQSLQEKIKPSDTRLVIFDERASSLSSARFSETLCQWRDENCSNVAFIIGGADGHAANFRKEADLAISFGQLTMPHQLVRILVMEQVYRALSIAANHPYHRQ